MFSIAGRLSRTKRLVGIGVLLGTVYANVVTEGSGGGSIPTPIPGNGGGFNPNPNSHYRIVNRNSNQVLDFTGASTANGAAVLQWPSTGGTNQQWSLVQVS